MREGRIGTALLAGLLLLQCGLVLPAVQRAKPGFGGDEPAYVDKASYIQEHGRFPRVPPGEWGRPLPPDFWGNSDWRPIGYPVFLAVVTGSRIDPVTTRARVAVVQFVGVAASLFLLYGAAVRGFGLEGRACLLLALGLGLQPWAFGFVTLVGPESLTMVLTWLGLLALAWAASAGGKAPWIGTMGGAAALTLAGLFRPDSLVLAPLIVGVGLLLGRYGRRLRLGLAATAAVVFLGVVSLQVAYRWNLTGRLEVFGPVRFFNMGFFRWLHTWVNTEKSAYDGIAYRIATATVTIDDIPSRAFGDRAEREEIARALELIRSGGYMREVDSIFAAVAEKRSRDSTFGAIVLPRLARTAQLWANLETNTQFLTTLAIAPRPLSKSFVAAAALGRGLVLVLFGVAVVAGCRELSLQSPASPAAILTFLSAAYVLLRTLLLGPVLGWMVARYTQPAWLPMLWCATAGAIWVSSARKHRGAAT